MPIDMVIENADGKVLSATEAEFIALSEGLHTSIPVMNLVYELSEEKIELSSDITKFKCRVFEDDSRAKTIETIPM